MIKPRRNKEIEMGRCGLTNCCSFNTSVSILLGLLGFFFKKSWHAIISINCFFNPLRVHSTEKALCGKDIGCQKVYRV